MNGKSNPIVDVTSQEIAEAFKQSGLPTERFASFAEGYRLGVIARAEEAYVIRDQCPPTHVETNIV